MPGEPAARHTHAPEFDADVGAGGKCQHMPTPKFESLAAIGIGPKPQQTTNVIERDRDVRMGAGELDQIR